MYPSNPSISTLNAMTVLFIGLALGLLAIIGACAETDTEFAEKLPRIIRNTGFAGFFICVLSAIIISVTGG